MPIINDAGRFMTDVIEFPASEVIPDFLPQPGNRYSGYALYRNIEPVSITFVRSNWLMISFPYRLLGDSSFKILNNDGDRDGEAAIDLNMGGTGVGYKISITGRNIFGLFFDLGNHEVKWIWALPEGRAALNDGKPVVHSIQICELATG